MDVGDVPLRSHSHPSLAALALALALGIALVIAPAIGCVWSGRVAHEALICPSLSATTGVAMA